MILALGWGIIIFCFSYFLLVFFKLTSCKLENGREIKLDWQTEVLRYFFSFLLGLAVFLIVVGGK